MNRVFISVRDSFSSDFLSDDTEENTPLGYARCELCNTKIRWVHILEHDDYFRPIQTGCCCALRLCNDYDAEAAEKELKSQLARRQRFLDPRKWEPSRKTPDNFVRRLRVPAKGIATVFIKYEKYQVFVAIGGDKECRWTNCSTPQEAMTIAFDLVEEYRVVTEK